MVPRPFRSALATLTCAIAGSVLLAQASPAQAGPVILPNAISFEYFGLNFASNVVTSNTVGTLDYGGKPGCGGVCTATTALGASPFISATVNEVSFQATGGGIVEVDLGYYIEYLNAPGTYAVNLHAIDSLSGPDGAGMVAALTFGQAGGRPGFFNDFATRDLREVDCANFCTPEAPGPKTGPFTPNNTVQMIANTPYFLQLSLFYRPESSHVQISGLIDPTFTDANFGGTFAYSPGVFDGAAGGVPEPATWAMMLTGFGGLGAVMRSRRRRATA